MLPAAAFRSASPSRHALALFGLLAALPPVLRADDSGCLPSPEDGIFCGEDPGGIAVHDHNIFGEVTESWDEPLYTESFGVGFNFHNINLAADSRLTIHGGSSLVAYPQLWVSGPGALRIASGFVYFDPSGRDFQGHVSGYAYTGGLEIAGGRLTVVGPDALGGGPLVLSGGNLTLANGYVSTEMPGFEVRGTSSLMENKSVPVSVTGTISGEGRLNLSGSFTLGDNNTHTLGTLISSGELHVGSDSALGAENTSVTLNAAALVATGGFASSARELVLASSEGRVSVSNSDTLTWNGPTSGAGTLVKHGSGTLALAGGIGHTGGARIDGGTLEVSVSSTLGDTGSTTWSGPISGVGHFAKSGAGTLVLTGAATHTGYTTVRGGTLKTGAANALSADSALFLINNATLDLNGHNQTVGDLDSYDFAAGANSPGTVKLGGATLTNLNRVTNNWAGAITGSGTFVKQGAATMHWSGSNTFTGTFRIDAGTVSTEAAQTLSPNALLQIAAGASLKLNDHDQTSGGLSGSGEVMLDSGALTVAQDSDTTFSGQIHGSDGALVKTGAGTLTLSGVNTFSGDLYLYGGTVRVAADSALGDASGRLLFSTGALETTAPLASAREVLLLGSGTLRTGADTTLSGIVSGAGALTKTGDATLTLSGDNTYSGGTVVQAGTLRAGHVHAFGSGGVEIGGGTVDFNGLAIANSIVNRGGTLTGLANYAGTQTIAGAVSFSGTVGGSLDVADAASLDTTGATFTGPVTVRNGGTLSGTGTLGTVTIAAGGTLSPGNSPGLLTLGDGSILEGTTLIEIGGLVRGDDHDAIDVLGQVGGLGSVTVGGTLQIVFWNGWTPAGEASFQIFRASSIGGTFAQIELPALAAGYEWNRSRLLSDGMLDIVASAIPEPASAAALAGLAFLGFAATRRRRR